MQAQAKQLSFQNQTLLHRNSTLETSALSSKVHTEEDINASKQLSSSAITSALLYVCEQ
jgi:hypothetical protein